MMQPLEKNVKNTWGKQGEIWLSQLPTLLQSLTQHWKLSELKPVSNMSFAYVALAIQDGKTPVVLKISCDAELIANEYQALQHFAGNATVKVLDINHNHHALLLEQAIPGDLLKQRHPDHIDEIITRYTQIVKTLAAQPLPNNNFTHVKQWCLAIDRIHDQRVDQQLIAKAQELKSFLLDSTKHEYLCHGDLHLENIIQHGQNWLAIDPKGIIGEIAFEAAAFDLLSKNELQNNSDILPELMTSRISKLASALEIDPRRLLSWFFVRTILSAQWFIEDNGDPSDSLILADHFYSLLQHCHFNKQAVCITYEKISDWYDQHRSRDLFEKSYLDRVISLIKPQASILDLGCGTGEPIARYFLEKGYALIGIDGSQAQINKAKANFSDANFILDDMRFIHLNTQFDCIIAWHSFFHLPQDDQRLMFAVFENHIKPGGILLFTSGPTAGEVWSDNGGEMLYHASLDPAEYQSLLEKHHFEVLCHKIADPECGLATVWLSRYLQMSIS